MLLPLLGAFIADAFMGRYRTIIISSVLYTLALGLLTLSAVLPSSGPSDCGSVTPCSPPQLHITLFFVSLYLVAFAQGGHKPCVQAFGADQFDVDDPKECKAKSSFFNWWFLGLCARPLVAFLVLFYIQDNLGWGLGFGIPCMVMGIALLVYLLGTPTYRYRDRGDERSVFVRIGEVFVKAAKNWKINPSAVSIEEEARGTMPYQGSQQFKIKEEGATSFASEQ